MNKQRPVNLDLTKMRFPITAIVSILHRISGVLLFLLVPLMLWALQTSLSSAAGFAAVGHFFANPVWKFVLWVLLSALLYHLVAGIKHLLMDWGIGEGLASGRIGSRIVIVLAIILIVLLGWWLW